MEATPHKQDVMRLFMKSVDLVGGLRGLAERHRLDSLTELMESAYVWVLHEEERRSAEEIADYLALDTATVNAILNSRIDDAIERFQGKRALDQQERDATAGGVVRLASRRLHDA